MHCKRIRTLNDDGTAGHDLDKTADDQHTVPSFHLRNLLDVDWTAMHSTCNALEPTTAKTTGTLVVPTPRNFFQVVQTSEHVL